MRTPPRMPSLSLDVGEMAEFEAHLASCAFCQGEVAEFTESRREAVLADPGDPTVPFAGEGSCRPSRMCRSCRASPIGAYQPIDSPNGRPSAGTPARPAGPRRALPDSWVPEEVDRPRVDELQLRRQRRRSRILSGLAAAMLIVAVGLGGVIYNLVQQREAAVAQAAFEQQLLRAEDVRVLVAPTLQGGGRCTFIVSRNLNRALYLGTNMPDPGPGRHYQLWTATGTESENDPVLDNPVPNQFGPGGSTSAVTWPKPTSSWSASSRTAPLRRHRPPARSWRRPSCRPRCWCSVVVSEL